MYLRAGIPRIADLEALKQNGLFSEHVDFNRRFLESHGPALRAYGAHWGDDPLRLWSRRWEYPFVASRILDYASRHTGPLSILDAGSGVTYFPYLLCDRLPSATIVCCDSDASYVPMFDAINQGRPASRVSFRHGILQSMPLDDRSIDAICCISVLEHTDQHREILREFARVLRPGGLLVLTFDLSLDGRFTLSKDQATDLFSAIEESFQPEESLDCHKELSGIDRPAELLSTDHVRRTEPHLLPWTHPLLLAFRDLLKGKGWTGGFRSKSVFCMASLRR